MSESAEYTPPKVWIWNKPNGGEFASINRPIAGPTHERELPVGKHPFQLYSLATPNGQKVTIMFEELLAAGHKGAEYDAWLIRIGQGDQFGSGFVKVNPNSKIPALVDRSGKKPIRVFESGAILMHLAEKFGAFLPTAQPARAEIPAAPQPAGYPDLKSPRGTADNLKKLTGVSGAIEKQLNDLGIFHYWQLAELDHDTAHHIGEQVGLPSRADGWVGQAKAMNAEAE